MKTSLVLLAVVAGVLSQTGIDRCGQTPIQPNLSQNPEDKIVGGTTAVPYSWPWQIVWCSVGWVVTAGHCVYGSTGSPGEFRVKTGVFNEQSTTESGEQLLKVKQIHLHPQYQHSPVPLFDISLIELANKVVYSDHVQPVCFGLNDTGVVVEPNSGWVTGWGTTLEGGSLSKQLKQVDVPFVNMETCDQEYQGDGVNDEVMICAGRKGIDTCQGDSGGPLVVENNGTWFLYGLTSWGYGCAEDKHPGVYSRTTAYCDWIAETTNNEVTCKNENLY